jgi:hypothetical protein
MKTNVGKLLAGTAAIALSLGFGGKAYAAADVSTAFKLGINQLNDESGELVMTPSGAPVNFGTGSGITNNRPTAGDIVLGVVFIQSDQTTVKSFDGTAINHLSGLFAFQVEYAGPGSTGPQFLVPFDAHAAVALSGNSFTDPAGYTLPSGGGGDFAILYQNTVAQPAAVGTAGISLQTFIDDSTAGSVVAIASINAPSQSVPVAGTGTGTTFASISDIRSFDPLLSFATGPIFPAASICQFGSVTATGTGNLCLTGSTQATTPSTLASPNSEADFTVLDQTTFKLKTVSVPEPASLAILGGSLVGFGWLNRRRARRKTRQEIAL